MLNSKNPISEFENFLTNNFTSIEKLEYWLLKNQELYDSIRVNYSCSKFEFKLPCFCHERTDDCLLVDLFVELEKLSYLKKCDSYLEKELEYYHNAY